MFLGGIFVFFPNPVHADSYKITHYHAQVDVQKNGDAVLTQRITYDFDGSFNGIYYNQDLRGIDDVSDVKVGLQSKNGETSLKQTQTSENNSYEMTRTDNELKLKVFHAIKDKTATFIYQYRLHGMITNYRDTAEMNWKIIGKNWDVALHDVQITIQLPARNITKLQAWTHGDLSGRTTVYQNDGKILIETAENPAGQFIESHLLFPTSVTPQNTKKVDKTAKERIQLKEARLAREANEKRRSNERLVGIFKYGTLGLYLLVFLGWLFWMIRHRGNVRQKLAPLVHSYEVPPFSAESAQIILSNGKPDANAFSAYLLELAAQKAVEIKPLAVKKNNYEVRLLDESILQENDLLTVLFENVGNGKVFTLAALKKFGKSQLDAKRLQDAFSRWQKEVAAKTDKLGFKDQENIKLRMYIYGWMTGLTVFAGILLFLLWGTWPLILPVGSLVLAYLASFSYTKKRPPYSNEGWQAYYQLQCFKKMLKDIGRFNLKEVGDLILWEQILPYAVVFGLADKVIKALKANFTVTELDNGFAVYYPFIIAGNTNFGSAFSANFTTAIGNSSSGIGGSGGFSGGSSGGVGGGSGGGAF
ncbi:hypothetical protein FD46_GL000955 [Liquorilactobacillus oeni DSM 19972]|uniref:Integral membrane protein n=2 Tax=Liquorilactobacillus oeni TaxID=303241 RepID=A0A0R1MAW3_9LACO|nr:hypothetical protein FD46_GL000955 [Liquorilactobacillus oeni DSM 19972]